MHVVPHNLSRHYRLNGGFLLTPIRETGRVPDVAFVRTERMPQGEARRHFPRLAPDLVVEVLSPTDRASDLLAKVARYQAAGAPLIWLVDPEVQTVTVLATNQPPATLHPGETLDGGNVLPDLQIAIADIFGYPHQGIDSIIAIRCDWGALSSTYVTANSRACATRMTFSSSSRAQASASAPVAPWPLTARRSVAGLSR